MNLRDIQYQVCSRVITQCKIVSKEDWFYMSLFYIEEQKWKLLRRKRRGVRIFKNAQSAIFIAEELGFNTVTLIEPTLSSKRED